MIRRQHFSKTLKFLFGSASPIKTVDFDLYLYDNFHCLLYSLNAVYFDWRSLMSTNVTNELVVSETSHEIWLDEDIRAVFAAKYWKTNEFSIGLIIIMGIAMIHIFCYAYYRPYKYDLSQKLIKLEAMNLDPILQKDVRYVLSPYLDRNFDLIQIIFEYSGITNNMDNIMQYLNSLMSSNISHGPSFLLERFCSNLLIWTPVIITYILFYHSIIFIIDSNRSFVEVPCVLAFDTSCTLLGEPDGKSKSVQKCIYEFDLSEYFDQMNTTENNLFYGEVYMTINQTTLSNYTYSVFCSINEDTMKYRYVDEGAESGSCTCDVDCCRKCGRCCRCCSDTNSDCVCCEDNCFLICCSIGMGVPIGYCGWIGLVLSEDSIKDRYRIRMRKPDDERLLIVGNANKNTLIEMRTITM